jgi:hypothetical protein
MRESEVGSALALMTCALASVGCFDVRPVDPGPPVLDDFEDGDLTPSHPPFTDWSCQIFHPDAALDCEVTEGFESSFALSVVFSISDLPDAVQQEGGVQMTTFADRPIDLTGVSAITFDVRLTSATTPFPPNAFMHLDLLCSTAVSENGGALVDFALVQSIAFRAEWSRVSLAISNFGPAPWQPEHIKGGATACLRAVDGIQFVFDPAVLDGQTGGGIFSIDDVVLQ